MKSKGLTCIYQTYDCTKTHEYLLQDFCHSIKLFLKFTEFCFLRERNLNENNKQYL